MSKSKRALFVLIVALIVVGVVVGIFIYKQTEFERLRVQRELVADRIAAGELEVQENGLVALPEELKILSDSGECVVVAFRGKTAIYFYKFRGLLESSKGYLYVTDRISYKDYIAAGYAASQDFVNVVELEPNWYSCSTD